MLRISSIPNEYYFGDKPGTLQYRKKPEDLLAIELPENNEVRGYNFCEHSLENLRRITPITQKKMDWKILLMMERRDHDGEIWLKAALQDRNTGEVALLTTTNKKEKLNKPIKTLHETWFVGHYRMAAPVIFWKELQNRLMY
jgi:hypothetical protein